MFQQPPTTVLIKPLEQYINKSIGVLDFRILFNKKPWRPGFVSTKKNMSFSQPGFVYIFEFYWSTQSNVISDATTQRVLHSRETTSGFNRNDKKMRLFNDELLMSAIRIETPCVRTHFLRSVSVICDVDDTEYGL